MSVWQYWQATRDLGSAWLREIAFPILAGIADFWTSRLVADTPGAVVQGFNDAAARAPSGNASAEAGSCDAAPGACMLHLVDVVRARVRCCACGGGGGGGGGGGFGFSALRSRQ